MYPITSAGRIVGAALMIVGVGVYGCLAAGIASFLLRPSDNENQEILRRLQDISDRLDRLEELAKQEEV